MTDIQITFAIIVAIVILFTTDAAPVVIVAIGTSLALYFTGVLDLQESMGGLGDPAVLFIASLFIVSAGLESTGVTAWAGQLLISKAGKSRGRLLVLTMLLVALLTALISVNGAVAALLPVVVVIAVRLNHFPSQLLMPLVFASHAGSMLALTGTPVNVLVSEAAEGAGAAPFGYFEFAYVGIPLLAGSMLIIILFGEKLLPNRSGNTVPPDLSRHARTLVEHYRLAEGLYQLRVRPDSPVIGMAPAMLRGEVTPHVLVVAIRPGDNAPADFRRRIVEGDIILVRGDVGAVTGYAESRQLALRSVEEGPTVEDTLLNNATGLAEVIIPPRSAMIGQAVFPGMVTSSGDVVILAVQRHGDVIAPREIHLEAGDTLLLRGAWKTLDTRTYPNDVLVVDAPELVRSQAVPLGPGAPRAIAVLVGMVIALATGIVPGVIAGLVAACAMILLRVLTVEQGFRAINWTTVILVGAMIPLSTAMEKSGAAGMLADGLVRTVGEAGPYALIAGLFLLTAILGQLISNTATALIIIPISVAAATEIGISPRSVLMSVTVAAAAAFLTPVATPVNLMVMAPGGYKFGDYWKLGLPLLIWFFVVSTFIVPMIWPLH